MTKPKQKDFVEWDRFDDGHVNTLRYAEALEKYCEELEGDIRWWTHTYGKLCQRYVFLRATVGTNKEGE